MMDKIEIYFDGSCDNSNKKDNLMGVGIAVFWNNEELDDYAFSDIVGARGTSNIAEWSGLILSVGILRKVVERERINSLKTKFILLGDSKLIINQASGIYFVRNERLRKYKDLYDDVCLSSLHLPHELKWIPRERNRRADELSKVKNILKRNQG